MPARGCPFALQIQYPWHLLKMFVDVFVLLAGALLEADVKTRILSQRGLFVKHTHTSWAFHKASCKRVFVLRELNSTEAVC